MVRGCKKLIEIAPKLFAPVIEEAKHIDWKEVKQAEVNFRTELNNMVKHGQTSSH